MTNKPEEYVFTLNVYEKDYTVYFEYFKTFDAIHITKLRVHDTGEYLDIAMTPIYGEIFNGCKNHLVNIGARPSDTKISANMRLWPLNDWP